MPKIKGPEVHESSTDSISRTVFDSFSRATSFSIVFACLSSSCEMFEFSYKVRLSFKALSDLTAARSLLASNSWRTSSKRALKKMKEQMLSLQPFHW